jgi:ribosome-associated protein
VTTRTDLYVSASLSIPRHELAVRASRAGGAGGQHVNTSSTRVELEWSVARSRALSDLQRERLAVALRTRLTADGTLRVVASERRSQAQNRDAAEGRLAALVRRGLAVPKRRRPTRPTRASVERRLEDKRQRGERKRRRRRDGDQIG